MWHRVEMVLTDVSEERIARFACGLSYNFPSTLKMEAIRSFETSVNTISTRCHIPEHCFLQYIVGCSRESVDMTRIKNADARTWKSHSCAAKQAKLCTDKVKRDFQQNLLLVPGNFSRAEM
jgi:hypothetical protein